MTYQSYLQEGGQPLYKVGPNPVATFDNCFMFQKSEARLCAKITETIERLRVNGYISTLAAKYHLPIK